MGSFQFWGDAQNFQRQLRERFAQFNLELAEKKTRLLLFGRFAAVERRKHGQRPEARRLQAELRAYLALLEGPRRLAPTDGDSDIAADASIDLVLRFSVEIAAAPVATLGGVALRLLPQGAVPTAVWKATVSRRDLPPDVTAAALVVSLPDAASPGAPLDSDPATAARPDPRMPARAASGRAVVTWQGLEAGEDRHHTILLRDPWSGLWARGESRIRIERKGPTLTGRLEKASEAARRERGFAEGAEVLRGSVSSNRRAQLQLLARYDRTWRQRCPSANAEYWARGDYALDAAGRISGNWEDRQLDETCKIAESVQQTDTLIRVQPAR